MSTFFPEERFEEEASVRFYPNACTIPFSTSPT
jgi:hypothetical protein